MDAHVDLNVRLGAVHSLSVSTVDFNCQNIAIASGGTLNLEDATVTEVSHFTIETGATLIGGSGTISKIGAWSNNGTVQPNSMLSFDATCGVLNSVSVSVTLMETE